MKKVEMQFINNEKRTAFRRISENAAKFESYVGSKPFIALLDSLGNVEKVQLNSASCFIEPKDLNIKCRFFVSSSEVDALFTKKQPPVLHPDPSVACIRKAYAYWFSKPTNTAPATIDELLEWYAKDMQDVDARIAEKEKELADLRALKG